MYIVYPLSLFFANAFGEEQLDDKLKAQQEKMLSSNIYML